MAARLSVVPTVERRSSLRAQEVEIQEIQRRWSAGSRRPSCKETSPPQGGILFVGSSIFREWREQRDFAADFAPLPVLNLAFGGSQTSDQLDVMVGPGRYCSPRHRMPVDSRNEGHEIQSSVSY